MNQWMRIVAIAAFAAWGLDAPAQKAGSEVETRLEARKVVTAADAATVSGDNPGSIVIGRVAALDLTDVNLTDVAFGFSRTSKEPRNASK